MLFYKNSVIIYKILFAMAFFNVFGRMFNRGPLKVFHDKNPAGVVKWQTRQP